MFVARSWVNATDCFFLDFQSIKLLVFLSIFLVWFLYIHHFGFFCLFLLMTTSSRISIIIWETMSPLISFPKHVSTQWCIVTLKIITKWIGTSLYHLLVCNNSYISLWTHQIYSISSYIIILLCLKRDSY